MVNDKLCLLLVDSGATSNFLSLADATELGLQLCERTPIRVRLADGNVIYSKRKANCLIALGAIQTILEF